MAYKDEVKKHLSTYKLNRLGVVGNGKWKRNDVEYEHILPEEQKDMNLLEPYRSELANHIEEENIHLHQDFHHLTSSQAVCLNFFYPLMEEKQLSALLEILKLEDAEVEECGFEKIMTRAEGTNFDYYIKLASGKQLFFEIKYTEEGFGKATPADNYQIKYENLYKEGLTEKLKPGLEGYEVFMKNYQLMRNISYVDKTDENVLIILYPEGNQKIRREYEDVMQNMIEPNFHPNILLMTWEDICGELIDVLESSTDTSDRLVRQYKDFSEKYLSV